MRWILCILTCLSLYSDEELHVDLRNPVYTDGILYTNEGGVITGPDLRIQAESIQYIQKIENGIPIRRIEAEGNLMIQYKGRAFVGTELEYDFLKKAGTVYDAKTQASLWYIGGDEIELKSDGSYKVTGGSITMSENKESPWDFHAEKIQMVKNEMLSAKNIRFRLFKIPTFWIPSFKVNLKKFPEPVLRYTLDWDRGQNPRAGIRYQFYSWNDLALYSRLEYRLKTGWGGAFESEFFPENSPTSFVTRSYVGTNRLETAPDKMFRYRLEGAMRTATDDRKTQLNLSWDKYSDVRMPSDFKSADFEVGTAQKTLLYLRHGDQDLIASLKARPRVNVFESIKQDLPTLFFTPFPRLLGKSGILSSFGTKLSFLDYAYSDQLAVSLSGYQSARLEAREKLQRPFHLGPLILTPYLGGDAIFYSSSPSHQPRFLAIGSYGASLHARAKRTYETHKHVIEPYIRFNALTKPSVSPDNHYIFSIQDGYNQINEIKWGLKQHLFSKQKPGESTFSADLFAYSFYNDPVIPQFFYRLGLDLSWHFPSLYVTSKSAYNFPYHRLDYTNNRIEWTLNENVAFAFEVRYRSRFDWRKADHDNYILNVTRSESELLLSPLSDRRITLLGDLFVRISPFWECRIQGHSGFYRMNQNPYTEIKVDLFTWISSATKLRLSYSHTDLDDRVTAGISILKK